MSKTPTAFVLDSLGVQRPTPVLTRVRADGRLDGLLFELTLRQTYRNTSAEVLEVVYTFPLPAQAVLLGIASDLNGARREGVVVEKRPAEARYEEALAAGDAPVLLEQLQDGLHSANIGNLAPGDELVLEVRYAQLLSFEQGRLRWSIPTTVAPRHGNAIAAGLQAHQVPDTSLTVEHPLTLSLAVGPALSGATLECPTHRFTMTRASDGTQHLELAPGGMMDRDVVFVATPREPRPSLVVQTTDTLDAAAPGLVMVALQPAEQTQRAALSIRMLVDCSQSMAGDSIASARAALRGVVAGLSEHDHLSLSRFGDHVEHLQAPAAATTQNLRRVVPLIERIAADLGGTEMESALDAVFALPAPEGTDIHDVLLVTDGEIWRTSETIEKARQGRHRVFVIGVGSSPSEAVLRSIAEATGGACEFATPGEALEAAAQRMLQRMRQPTLHNHRMDWGRKPSWQSGLSRSVFAGDTLMVFAGFASRAPATAIRLLADDAQGRTIELARGEAAAPVQGDSLPRMAAAGRLQDAEPDQARKLALQYQLLSPDTRCLLVHLREEADKPQAAPTLHRVPSMVAAGWGGTGSVRSSKLNVACAGRTPYGDRSPAVNVFDSIFGRSSAPAAAARAAAVLGDPSAPPPVRYSVNLRVGSEITCLALRVLSGLSVPPHTQGLALHCSMDAMEWEIEDALKEALGDFDSDQVLIVFAHWANTRPNGLAHAALTAALEPFLAALDPVRVARVLDLFERRLGCY